ncbi:MAG: hypothetical protein ACK55Z_26030, partial [bacterium]
NQRFQTAHDTRGSRETGNRGTLPHGNSREHGGTGNQRAGGEICRREERRRAASKCFQEKTTDRDSRQGTTGGCGGADFLTFVRRHGGFATISG